MFGALLKGLFWFVVAMTVLAVLAINAQAQPPTYLPWQYGVTHRVIQGNHGGYSHNTQYTEYGWDFDLTSGTPVLAVAPGRVTIAAGGWNGGWGNTVTVCYSDGTCSRYGHLSSVSVGSGQSVGQGQPIGLSGNTGNSSGPHLHYQLESGNGTSLPSSFVEVGVPGQGQSVTSRNQPGEYKGTLNAQFPADSAGVVHATQGDKIEVGFNLWNNGTRVWEDFRLALVTDPPENMRSRAWGWDETTRLIPGDRQRVEPDSGTNVRFRVTPEEYNAVGDYDFHFKLFDRGTGAFIPGTEPSFVLRVEPACYTAAFVGQSVTPLVAPGESGLFEVALRNTGTCTWYSGGSEPVRLGTQNPQDGPFRFAEAGWADQNRIPLSEDSVPPGSTGHFRASITVPPGTPAGRYQQFWAPVADGRQWFARYLGVSPFVYVGDRDHLPFQPADYAAQWISQTYLGTLHPGDTGEVRVTYRNIGRAVLFPDGEHPVHLRGSRQADRESSFVDRTSPLAVGSNRAQGYRLDQDRVNPGEEFSFTMPIRVADWLKPGTYVEYFLPVAEGMIWFGPDDVWWKFDVVERPPAAPTTQPVTPTPTVAPATQAKPTVKTKPARKRKKGRKHRKR